MNPLPSPGKKEMLEEIFGEHLLTGQAVKREAFSSNGVRPGPRSTPRRQRARAQLVV